MKQRMARLEIIGLKPQLAATIHTLHRLGCVQIVNVGDWEDVSARPLELAPYMVREREAITHTVTRIAGILAALGVRPGGRALIQPLSSGVSWLAEAEAGVKEVAPQVQRLVDEREALEAEQSSLPRYEATLRRLLPVMPPAAQNPGNATVSVMVNRGHRWVLDSVTEAILEQTGGRAQTAVSELDSSTLAMVIVIPRPFLSRVEQLLGREDISRLRLPEAIAGQAPDKAVALLNQRLAAIPQELAAIHAELAELAGAWGEKLQHWHDCLRDQLDEVEVLSNLGETDHTFVLVGWIAEADVAQLRTVLTAQVGDGIVVHVLPVNRQALAQAPVVLANRPPVRPFESLVRLFGLPGNWDVDPTFLMALFMPMFFGMILGDIGYGLLLLLLSLLALRRFRTAGTGRDIIIILAMGAAWSVLFGILYGEAFGTLGEQFGLHPLLFDRADASQVTSLLIFTIALGLVHQLLGLAIGVWVAARQRSRSHLLERGGMLLGLIGLFFLTAALARWLPDSFKTPGVVTLLIGIVLLSASHGWLGLMLGPIEFIGVLGNVLSYLRIAAVGLASVYVARLANDVAGVFGAVVVGIIVALLLHALNLVLGAFSPTIHSMRLHYVEFFRKFYTGGGRPFVPFRSRLTKVLSLE